MRLGANLDPIYAPDGKTWYETALAEAEKRGKYQDALELALSVINDDGGKNTEVLNAISLKLAEER